MRKHLFILSTLVMFTLCSCQKFAGDLVTQDFNIEGAYTELQVENGFEVTVSDVATSITIIAGENVMPNVVVEIVGNKLRIHLKPMASSYGSEMKVILPYNADLINVDLSGGSEFHSEYGLDGEKIEVDLSGGSEFYCDLHADEIELDLSGGSEFFGNVEADEIDMELSGASEMHYTGNAATTGSDCTGGSEISHDVL